MIIRKFFFFLQNREFVYEIFKYTLITYNFLNHIIYTIQSITNSINKNYVKLLQPLKILLHKFESPSSLELTN